MSACWSGGLSAGSWFSASVLSSRGESCSIARLCGDSITDQPESVVPGDDCGSGHASKRGDSDGDGEDRLDEDGRRLEFSSIGLKTCADGPNGVTQREP